MKPNMLFGLVLIFAGGLLGCGTNSAMTQYSVADRQWGNATNGLQMGLSVSTTSNRNDPEFEVAFRNLGEQDVCLNLGSMLDNGRVLLPDKIHLNLLDGSGRNRDLQFSDRRYPAVAGRLDDYVVPLRAGSTYSLGLRLDQFWSPSTKEFDLKLTPGRYVVSAQFQENRAETRNLIFVWKGKLQSDEVNIVK